MTLYLSNLVVYSLQLAALVMAAYAITLTLRLQKPRLSLGFWQVVMAIALLLPLLQPRRAEPSALFIMGAAASGADAANRAAIAAAGVDGTMILFALIAIGIVLRLLWLAAGLMRLRSIVAGAVHDASLAAVVGDLDLPAARRAAVKITDDLEGPATIGARRPVILLPRSVLMMPAPVQRAIVCHELVHVQRRDWLATIGEELWCALLWFHPAARAIASRLSLARETVVDEITIRLTRDRRAYAEALLAFSNPQPHVIGATPFIGRRTLGQRISLIAQEDSMSRFRATATLVVALAVSGGITWVTVDRVPMSSTLYAQSRVYEPGDGVSLPYVLTEVKPEYTQAALQAKIQGSVFLRIVVTETGDVTGIEVSKSLDTEYGLDQAAVAAAEQWKFRPGMKDGNPVPVKVTLELTFKLK